MVRTSYSFRFIGLILCIVCAIVFFYQPVETSTVSAQEEELRGVWISTVSNIDYPTRQSTDPEVLKKEMIAILDHCKDMGFNAVFLQVRPASDAFYPSDIFPWSRYLTGTQGVAPDHQFDPLAFAIEEAHARGIQLHAWINPYRVTTSASENNRLASNNPAVLRPELVITDENGKMYYNPGEVETIDLIVKGAMEIVNRYDIDGLHMDDYFYPDGQFNDDGTYSFYKEQYPNRGDWRRSMVNQLVKRLDQEIHQAKPDVQFGISPRGIWANDYDAPGGSKTRGGGSYNSVFADSKAWVENGWVDYIMPQIYWSIGYEIADYEILCDWWSDVVKGTDVKLYIGEAAYRTISSTSSVWRDQNGANELRNHIQIGRESDEISGYCMFTYNSFLNNSYLDALMKEINPQNTTPIETSKPVESAPPIADEVAPVEEIPTLTNPDEADKQEGAYENKFTDLANHWWALEEINALASQGIIRGQDETTFAPDKFITRADNVALLLRVLGKEATITDNFVDVSPDSYYYTEVGMAKALGIIEGNGNGYFYPTSMITRQDMATMAYRVLLQEKKLTAVPNQRVLNDFNDKDDVDYYAKDAMAACVSAGLIKGDYYQPLLNPKNNATRVEVAIFVYRIQQLLNK